MSSSSIREFYIFFSTKGKKSDIVIILQWVNNIFCAIADQFATLTKYHPINTMGQRPIVHLQPTVHLGP